MEPFPAISFDNTETAFTHKSDAELRKARWLFSLMSKPWLVKLGIFLLPPMIKAGLPIRGLIRKTIFGQFVGGESLEQTAGVSEKLADSNVKVILDYGVEGKEGEANFEHACDEFIKVINYAGRRDNIPFMSVKVTGIARFGLLEKLDEAAGENDGINGLVATHALTGDEKREWENVINRMHRITAAASQKGVGVLIDAEESWIQDPVDAVVMQMMETYNKSRVVVYNTIQLYRHDRFEFMKQSFAHARTKGTIPGFKVVRGAYMEKERKRAADKKYPSQIQPDKESTDRDYNASIKFCLDNIGELGLIVASHNEESNLLTAKMMIEKGLPLEHPRVHFSQLYGMSDNITFNLARAGFSVSKYLPFGPIKDVIPYLMRRAQENTSVGGQTSRELSLISQEIQRRSKR